MNKTKEICNKVAFNVPYVMIISYVLDKGMGNLQKVTDDQIAAVKGNDLMTDDFTRAIVRAGVEVSKNCTQQEFIAFVKSEWCGVGEVYDPDRDQFIKEIEEY